MAQFELQDCHGNNVLGGTVGLDNVYIRAYPSLLPGEKTPATLEVGESSRAYYSLSGQKKTMYYIVRVK